MRAKHSMQDYLNVVRDGTARHYEPGGPRKKVIIVGAGLAGLSAA